MSTTTYPPTPRLTPHARRRARQRGVATKQIKRLARTARPTEVGERTVVLGADGLRVVVEQLEDGIVVLTAMQQPQPIGEDG
jgi:hypothetical protein